MNLKVIVNVLLVIEGLRWLLTIHTARLVNLMMNQVTHL